MTTSDLGRVRPIYRGAYSPTATYTPLDFLSYDGNMYFCTLAATGVVPTDTGYFQPVIDPSWLVTLSKFNADMAVLHDEMAEKADKTVQRTKASLRNRLLNGAFQVCQDRASGAAIAISSSGYVMDGWAVVAVGGGVLTCSQVLKTTPGGSPYRLKATVTKADVSLEVGDAYYVIGKIEGIDVADLMFGTVAAKPFCWRGVVNLPSGTYGLSFANADNTRSFVKTFTISTEQAGTDVLITAVVPGCTDGTWIKDASGIGLTVRIALAMGSTRQTATVNDWVSGEYYTTSAQANGMLSTANAIELADVGLYVGADVPDWEMPSYSDDIAKCLRYYRTGDITGWGHASASVNGFRGHIERFGIPMRNAPYVDISITKYSSCSASVLESLTNKGFSVTVTGVSGTSYAFTGTYTATSRL